MARLAAQSHRRQPPQVQPIYGIAGEHRLNEWEVSWLPGFEGAHPVRVGNAAFTQFQLDIFGEILNAGISRGRRGLAATEDGWNLQKALLKHLEEVWDQPDEGIWEVRGGRQHFVHSKVMAWVAFDRGIKAVEQFGLEGPVERWRSLRDKIHAEVCARGFDRDRGAFVQAFGSQHLDASTLLIPIVGFLPRGRPAGPRHGRGDRARADAGRLRASLRHRQDEGRPAARARAPFSSAASGWRRPTLFRAGRQRREALFERLLALRNDVGLLAEEYDPKAKTFLGNFPQALSHLALANAAHQIAVGGPHRAPASLSP